MTAVSDETGREALQRCPEGCVEYQAKRSNNPFLNCGRCGTRMVQVLPAALSASPVAQEPVARLCGYCKTWNSKPCGEQCYLQPSDPVWTAPPATSAGLGADEIAQIIATKCFDPRVIDSSGKPFWKKSQWREAQQAANAILALLSRAGDQGNSTQKDGSR